MRLKVFAAAETSEEREQKERRIFQGEKIFGLLLLSLR